MKNILLLVLSICLSITAYSQDFYFGHDLSYTNQMEDCGAVFKEGGEAKDVYQIFADQGTNLVRVRLWVDPAWQNDIDQPEGVKAQYSDLEDVKETISRAKAAGMQVMLGLQYSDVWADPGRQLIPADWLDIANDTEALKTAVYDYTVDVLTELNAEGLMPDIVKIGNENNAGILLHTSMNEDWEAGGRVSSDWSRHAQLYNAAIKAVRDVGESASVNPKIALHYSGLSGLKNWYERIISNGVTDFDIMGFSYYYGWHEASISELGSTVRDMVASFPDYEIMVVETGYLWTTENHDALNNIISTPDPEYLPVIPEKQLEYMVDFTREVMNSGGIGVVFWEPAWVSTPCRTPWGQGSSQDHVVFFDPVNTNFMENGGGRWTNPEFYEDLETVKVTFQVDMSGQEVSNGVYVTGDFTGTDWQLVPMAHEGNNIYSYVTWLSPESTGAYYFLNGNNWDARETVPAECATMWEEDRGYTIPDENVQFAYKWASCEEAPTLPQTVQVTFMVDMTDSGEDLSKGVFIVGDLNDWTFTPLTDIGNNLYRTTLELTPGEELAYYYITNNSWEGYMDYRETVPAECALNSGVDRLLTVPAEDAIVGFKWSSCERVEAPEVPVTFKVDMTGQDVSNGVYITGDFTGEQWSIVPMTEESDMVYSYTIQMNPGEVGAYFFLNANDWEAREAVPAECAVMWNTDRKYEIPAEEVTYAYTWGSCAWGEEPQEPATVQVTFKVNMRGRKISNGVYITGDFTGDPWEIIPMTHVGGGTYAYTTNLEAGSEGAYYFLNRNDFSARESVPAECATMNETDRKYVISNENVVYEYSWGYCELLEEPPVTTGLGDLFVKGRGVYPNPTTGAINLNFTQAETGISIEIYNQAGQLAFELGNQQTDEAGNLKVELNHLPAGFYLLKASARGENLLFGKFVKE